MADEFVKFLGTAGARFVMARQLRYSAGTFLCLAGQRIMLDPGPGTLLRCAKARPRIDPAALDAVILTHAHIDHSGEMNSSANRGRLVRAVREDEEVFVLGATRLAVSHGGAVSTASDLIGAAEARAAAIIDDAVEEARRITAEAESRAAAVRAEAYDSGREVIRQEVFEQFDAHLALIREAAQEGKDIRDAVAAQSAALVARAVGLATRRIVGEYYEADSARTGSACADALRSAAGQEILMIRVNPAVAGHVQAALADVARYVRPDESIEVGGCIVDLKHGTIDATLETRLSLMELALGHAGGELS